MKTTFNLISTLLACLFTLVLAACEFDKKTELRTELNQIEQKIESEMERLDHRIAELEKEAENVADSARREIDAQVINLKTLKIDLAREAKNLQNTTHEQLTDIRLQVSRTLQKVGKALATEMPDPGKKS